MDSNEFGSSTACSRRDKRNPHNFEQRRQNERYLRFGYEQIRSKAFDAIRKIEGVNVVLTSMGTHIETRDLEKENTKGYRCYSRFAETGRQHNEDNLYNSNRRKER